ncbi:protein translocase subunit SecF [Helcobacillus massiliensis]|uniref:Protein-export membrane protein SecF n=1 Tax=Helcobacillus massiliensis TaxID=521392 RepID=A0A839QX64_9MICO|nr:protein translocase subunit SecF [Helcobacillus massiliensis]MBB3022571.1 preprotein translocase subunit SecF [Helcobacillus massiliensis]MDK7742844.1 protein translocase subunit SecF [Helcobacillus massiliensis]WOO94074.1 protein translocase subunit SecF [Helcobacillus massiliensis]
MSTLNLAEFGNDLHSGKRSFGIVTRRRTWYAIAIGVLLILGIVAGVRGFNWGIDFTGGSEFQVPGVSVSDTDTARTVVRDHVPDNEPTVTALGSDTLRIQTQQLDSDATKALAADLASAYSVDPSAVSTSFIGPNWGQGVTDKAIRGVLVFLALVGVVMALYFRNWKASAAALLALLSDLIFTVVAYGAIGFEITPATIIGFLTVLGYSLYDTVVVFDKVRENTAHLPRENRTFEQLVNLAANQTLVRSINTSVVALLPVGAILVIGAFLLGAGTLKDISLVLFIGIISGTFSSIFLAPGLLVDLRSRERGIREHSARVASAPAQEGVAA